MHLLQECHCLGDSLQLRELGGEYQQSRQEVKRVFWEEAIEKKFEESFRILIEPMERTLSMTRRLSIHSLIGWILLAASAPSPRGASPDPPSPGAGPPGPEHWKADHGFGKRVVHAPDLVCYEFAVEIEVDG